MRCAMDPAGIAPHGAAAIVAPNRPHGELRQPEIARSPAVAVISLCMARWSWSVRDVEPELWPPSHPCTVRAAVQTKSGTGHAQVGLDVNADSVHERLQSIIRMQDLLDAMACQLVRAMWVNTPTDLFILRTPPNGGSQPTIPNTCRAPSTILSISLVFPTHIAALRMTGLPSASASHVDRAASSGRTSNVSGSFISM